MRIVSKPGRLMLKSGARKSGCHAFEVRSVDDDVESGEEVRLRMLGTVSKSGKLMK